MIPEIQYITDSAGHKKSVIITLEKWELLQQERVALENKIQFLEELKSSIEEVKEVLKGNKTSQSLSAFLDEL